MTTPRKLKAKPIKKSGFAPSYDPIIKTLDLPLAKVRFNKQKVTFHKKSDGKKLHAVYETPHGVSVVYGRLQKDNGAYLLALLRKLERDQDDALFRKQKDKLIKGTK